MTDTLLVTSTESGTGKTAIAISLGRLAQDRGKTVGYMKPKGTRLRTRVGKVLDTDPLFAQEVLGLTDAIETMEPVVYSSTFLQHVMRGDESVEAIHAALEEAHQQISRDRDLVIIEGGDTLTTGGVIDLTDADIATLLNARMVLVAAYPGLTAVDELLATIDHCGDRLDGVLFNAVGQEALAELESLVIPYLEARGHQVLGVLPRERELATVPVTELANEIGATILTAPSTNDRVARYVVGAMSSDRALRHFRRTRDAVVITGGDRPGIQAAAIEAPGIRGIVLTGGYRPPPRIITTAEDAAIPIMSVDMDTLGAIERVEDVLGAGRVRGEAEVALMRELLSGHTDLDVLLGCN